MIAILGGFIALINGYPYIGIAIICLMMGLASLLIKSMSLARFIWISALSYLITYFLASSGGLIDAYHGLDVFLLFLGLDLAILYEVLSDLPHLKLMFKPYLFTLIALVVFTTLAFISRDNLYIVSAYPFGVFSLLSLIDIIFMPYLLCMTLSFVSREYNKEV